MSGKFKNEISPTVIGDGHNTKVKTKQLWRQNVAAVCIAAGAVTVVVSVLVTVLVYIIPSVGNNTETRQNEEDVNQTIDEERHGDCQEILEASETAISGIYTIYPYAANSTKAVEVYCDMTNNSGWVVFQRRHDGSENFFRNWNEYKEGFGNLGSEFWLGLEIIHEIVSSGGWELFISLKDDQKGDKYAFYRTFSVGDENGWYVLTVGNYTRNSGDALSYHSGMKFSTKDRDNDLFSYFNCAVWLFEGAWWYENCATCELNRSSGDIYWNGFSASIEHVEMKMKRTV